MERRRAFVMVYAVCTLVLISSLSFSMVDSTGSDLEIAKLRMYQAFARVNAESGIEYALGFVTRELGKHPDVANGIDGGPWLDIGYNFRFETNPWFWSLSHRPGQYPLMTGRGYTSYNSQAEGPPFRLHEILGTAPQLLQASQFQIALAPTMTYANVKLATVGPPSRPTIFTIRSRGEVLQNLTGRPIVMGSAYAVQTFAVGFPQGSCGTPRPLRQVFDRNPATLAPAGMLSPNPH